MPIFNFRQKFESVMEDCARGYQRCHECWALDCCDNLISHELKRLENENKRLKAEVDKLEDMAEFGW